MNLMVQATGAVMAGGSIQGFIGTVLNTPAGPTLSSIMNSLKDQPAQQRGGGSAKKEHSKPSSDDSLFLAIIGFITLGGMATAVLRSLPNRRSS